MKATGEAGPGYRVAAPAADAMIALPDAFGTRFAVFVDTEEEFDWSAPFSRDADGTSHLTAMPEAHARFAQHGVPLTWLVDHPIVACARSVDILRVLLEDGRSAVGTQLHPWVNPPFDETLGVHNSFAGNLPKPLQLAKLQQLTDAITTAFGSPPLIYRAGRYGIGIETPDMLASLGYRLDSSMRPGYDYSNEGGPDFTDVPNRPFRIGADRMLVELPLTTVFTGRLRANGARFHRTLGRIPRGRGIAARTGMLSRVALTPEDMPLGEALEAIRIALGEGVRLLNFSFHSPSLVPGHTPYVRDAADLTAFYRWWDCVFALLGRRGVAPASLAEIVDAACGPPPTSASGGSAGGL